jgi:hypothetical protein
MGKIIGIEEGMPHRAAELICIKCGVRGMHIWPSKLKLCDLYCEGCGVKGFLICTGEVIEE